MKTTHKVIIHFRQKDQSYALDVPHGENILQFFELSGIKLPFLCRNGCCTTCAVRILSGVIEQSKGIGLSKELKQKGYALLCIANAISDLEIETQDEDEVYEKQFGKYLGSIKENVGNPFDI